MSISIARSPYSNRPEVNRLVTPEQRSQDKEFFARIRHDWQDFSDVPPTQEATVHLADSTHRIEIHEPTSGEPEGVIGYHYPYANPRANKGRISGALMAEMTNRTVVSFANNFPPSQAYNERYSPRTIERIRNGILGDVAIRRLRIVRAEADKRRLDNIYSFGPSEGGAIAAASAEFANDVGLKNIFTYEPANSVERTSGEVWEAFSKANGERDYIQAARDTGIPALLEAHDVDRGSLKRSVFEGLWIARSVMSAVNRSKIAGLGAGTLEDDLALLEEKSDSRAFIAWGVEGELAPHLVMGQITKNLEARMPDQITGLAIKRAGHDDSNDIFFESILARHAANL